MPPPNDTIKQIYHELGPFDFSKYPVNEEDLKRYEEYPVAGPYEIKDDEAVYKG